MSGIGKPVKGDNGEAKVSIDQLKGDFDAVMVKIRGIIGTRKDKNQMSAEEKRELRVEYMRAANIAKKIYERAANDDALEEKFKDLHKRCLDKAEGYGAIMKREVPKTTLDDIKGQQDVKTI